MAYVSRLVAANGVWTYIQGYAVGRGLMCAPPLGADLRHGSHIFKSLQEPTTILLVEEKSPVVNLT